MNLLNKNIYCIILVTLVLVEGNDYVNYNKQNTPEPIFFPDGNGGISGIPNQNSILSVQNPLSQNTNSITPAATIYQSPEKPKVTIYQSSKTTARRPTEHVQSTTTSNFYFPQETASLPTTDLSTTMSKTDRPSRRPTDRNTTTTVKPTNRYTTTRLKPTITPIYQYQEITTTPNYIQKLPTSPTTNEQEDYDDFDGDDGSTDVYTPYTGPLIDEFDWKLVSKAMAEKNRNIFLSPFSIKVILMLLLESTGYRYGVGKATQTTTELEQILSNQPLHVVDEIYAKIFNSISQNTNTMYDIQIGTKIFVDSYIELYPEYLQLIEQRYSSSIDRLAFSNIKNAVATINSWVSGKTKGNIRELVDENFVSNTIMILVNAIYFKGIWVHQFPEFATRKFDFYSSNARKAEIDFMQNDIYLYYYESPELRAQIVRLPYRGERYSMLVVLPNPENTLRNMMPLINSRALQNVRRNLKLRRILIRFPKFKFDYMTDLNEIIRKVGIYTIFTENAELTYLTKNYKSVITKTRHKAGIIVDEKGSTAYAATAAGADRISAGVQFKADRPFLFFIEDEQNGALLFAGKVENPHQLQ
uniref:Putative salivary serpin n=1 Tax=Corethrella appendiculata TaxID=1370023 RepID=U5EVT1_9DIPT